MIINQIKSSQIRLDEMRSHHVINQIMLVFFLHSPFVALHTVINNTMQQTPPPPSKHFTGMTNDSKQVRNLLSLLPLDEAEPEKKARAQGQGQPIFLSPSIARTHPFVYNEGPTYPYAPPHPSSALSDADMQKEQLRQQLITALPHRTSTEIEEFIHAQRERMGDWQFSGVEERAVELTEQERRQQQQEYNPHYVPPEITEPESNPPYHQPEFKINREIRQENSALRRAYWAKKRRHAVVSWCACLLAIEHEQCGMESY